jgi:CHASE2 domain-containing sensor protein
VPGADAGIALVYVTDNTLARLPYTTPIDRQLMADIINAVDAAGPKAIGLDFIFDRATEPAKDQALLDAIHQAKSPIILGTIGAHGPEPSFGTDLLAKSQRPVGHLFFGDHHQVLIISDNVVRTSASRDHGLPTSKSFAGKVRVKNRRNPGPFRVPRRRSRRRSHVQLPATHKHPVKPTIAEVRAPQLPRWSNCDIRVCFWPK